MLKEAISEIRAAVNNPFSLKHFYILFVVAASLLLLTITSITLRSKTFFICKPFQLRFSGGLEGGKGKIYQFSYGGPDSCKIVVSPTVDSAKDLSLWVYKPDKSIQVIDLSSLDTNKSSIKTDGENGTYKLSIRNKDKTKSEYELQVFVSNR